MLLRIKKLTIVFFFLVSLPCLAQTEQYITIKKNSLAIENLIVSDSVGANNRMDYSFSFDIYLTNDEKTIALLHTLDQSSASGEPLTVVLGYLSASAHDKIIGVMTLLEERTYSNAVIKEFLLGELNGAGRDRVKLHVVITGGSLQVKDGNNIKVTNPKSSAELLRAVNSNFRFSLGNLITRKVAVISSLNIGSPDEGKRIFTVELSEQDKQSWSGSFNNGAGTVIADGMIEVMSQDFKTVLLRIYLKDVVIISYRHNSSTAATAARVSYGLRAGSISFKHN